MKKHHYFERKRTKMILASSLAAVAIAGFAGCAEQGTVPTSQMDTKESARHEETFFSQTQIPSSTTSLETTCAETTAATSAEIPQTTQAAQTEPVPDSVLHMERTEDTEVLPYETVYEYSDRYYAGVRRVKQEGQDGALLRVTVTTYENGVALETSVTELVVTEPVDQIVVIGTKSATTQERQTVTENVIPYETEWRKDPTRYDDEREVLQRGVNGYTEALYLITYEKGIEISRERISEKVIAAQTEIISIGTMPAWEEKRETERADTVAFRTEYVYDDTLPEGKRIVRTVGKNGYTENVYAAKYYRGAFSSRDLVESTVYEPITEVIVVGTKREESFGLPFLSDRGYTLSQDYGNGHYAMDFAVWYGDPILAVKSGTVIYAYDEGDFSKSDPNWTYGTFVVIEHENGVRSLYAHLKSRTVSAGDRVAGGQTIGYSGNTGRVNPAPTPSNPLAGTHLHFEIRVKRNGSYVKVDPKQYIPY